MEEVCGILSKLRNLNKSNSKPKPTLESLLKESQAITGKDLIKRKEEGEKAKAKQLEEFAQEMEFEERNNRGRVK
jgi:hypothetical protein